MTDKEIQIPDGLSHMGEDENALAAIPLIDDRIEYHRKRLPAVRYYHGEAGLSAYLSKFPEARRFRMPPARWEYPYQNKPKGYDETIIGFVDQWFLSDTYINESNRAWVERLNIAMAPRVFNPDNHFSKPLSAGRLQKIAEIFAKHGARLDTSKRMSMSQVREAVKAAKASSNPEAQPLGRVGMITRNSLIIGPKGYGP